MQGAEGDLRESADYLRNVIREARPDLLHLSQFCYGAMDVKQPKIVVAHSDVLSWNQAVHGGASEWAMGEVVSRSGAEGTGRREPAWLRRRAGCCNRLKRAMASPGSRG